MFSKLQNKLSRNNRYPHHAHLPPHHHSHPPLPHHAHPPDYHPHHLAQVTEMVLATVYKALADHHIFLEVKIFFFRKRINNQYCFDVKIFTDRESSNIQYDDRDIFFDSESLLNQVDYSK